MFIQIYQITKGAGFSKEKIMKNIVSMKSINTEKEKGRNLREVHYYFDCDYISHIILRYRRAFMAA